MSRSREAYNNYTNQYLKERYKKRRIEAVQQLGGKCICCGTTEDLIFHHINPQTKEFTISKASTFSEERWQNELSKCELLCESCHKIKHNMTGEVLIFTCPKCGIEFSLSARTFKFRSKKPNYKGPFCSRKCGSDFYRKPKKIKEHPCKICQKMTKNKEFCSKVCASFHLRKVERPTSEVLKKNIQEMTWTAIAKLYKVDLKTIQKWARQYNIWTKE